MLKGFRDFIMRGNVVELAIGVVIGVAFNSLVTGFTTDFINPLIKIMSGGKEFSGSTKIGSIHILWGDFINQIINFTIVAAILYFLIVMPMNKLEERRRRGKPVPAAAIAEDIQLLREIRDALVHAPVAVLAQNQDAASAAPAQRDGTHRVADDTTA